jgi:transmembrane sensor
LPAETPVRSMTNPPNPPSENPDPTLAGWLREHRAPGEPSFDADAAWSRFAAHRFREHSVARGSFWRGRGLIVAATSALAAAAVVFAVVSRHETPAGQSIGQTITRVAAAGQLEVITLADGSRITLNGGSTLRYASQNGDRDVYLDGEALFEITHDPRRAFRVHAANGIIRDIGTKFIVRAYRSTHAVEVAVTEGRVAFGRDSAGNDQLDLAAGDAAALDVTGALAKLPASSVDRLTGWTTGALVFENVRLADAAQDIEHRYGVRVIIADSALARRPVVARFHGEPVAQVLDAVTLALGTHYDVEGSTYTLRSGRR